MKGINATNFEEWFFEYFEGTLRKEEKERVINFIESDPVYREEFEYWEKSYVREPLPGKLKIENSLLKKEPLNLNYIFSGVILLFLAGVILYFNLPLTNEPTTVPSMKSNSTSIVPLPEIKSEGSIEKRRTQILKDTKIVPSGMEGQPGTELTKESLPLAQEENVTQEKEKEIISVEKVDSITTLASNEIPLDSINQEVVPTNKTSKKLSPEERKKRREEEKFKQKALEKKQEGEFLKGKVPYVVPVNPNNF